MNNEMAFNMASSNIRYGPGASLEIGMDLADMGAKNVMVVTDPNLAKLDFVSAILGAIEEQSVRYTLFDQVRVEPTDASLKQAIDFAAGDSFDAFVGIGGGSALDTAKAANLYSTYPADFLDYVNAPIGKGKPIPGPLKPLLAVPTTSGTGSETTGVVIFDLVEMHAKTGIANLRLKPTLGIL
ncbi:MAG: iron-containing alcohol dehydrogenase, partial [Planctomycetota bacterium]